MKNRTLSVIGSWLMAIAVLCIGCENAAEQFPEADLLLTLSADTVYLTQNQLDESALTFKWTSGTNHGTGSAIRYTLLLTIGDTTAAWEIDKKEGRMLTLTHDQLNDSILRIVEGRDIDISDGFYHIRCQLQAEVVMTGEIQTSPEKLLLVSTFHKQLLYLIGTAAPYGWSRDKAVRILSDVENKDLFRWSGALKKGEFKFLTTTEDWNPCYVRDSNDPNKMALRLSDDDSEHPDNTWKIRYEGNYIIECNTRDLTISITPLTPEPDYGPVLYMVGSATRYGWDANRSQIMLAEVIGEDTVFTWSGELTAGEIKFLVQPDEWLPCYVRHPQDARHILYREGEGPDDPLDLKWLIPYTAQYTVTIHMLDKSIRIESEGKEIVQPVYTHVYMIGSAAPNGWSWDNIAELTPSASDWNIFTWQGTLKEGQIKFPTEYNTDWTGQMLFAPVPDCAPTLNGTYDAHAGNPDNKWLITEQGIYRITIDATRETISFEKL